MIDARTAGRRVDSMIAARFPKWSRTAIARYIRAGAIVSEDRQLKPSSTLHPGERLRLYVPGLAPDAPPPPLPPVVFEDERILVFNKPAGLLVHPSGQSWTWALIGLARQAWPGVPLDLVHRLDRETSGIVVLTKDGSMNAFLKEAFKQHLARKTYQAIARGVIPWERLEATEPIGHPPASEVRLRQGIVADGLSAHTTFKVLQRLDAHTLVACHLHSGRTHQIRVHLEAAGYPILGDKLYGHPDAVFLRYLDDPVDPVLRATVGFPRHALHASRLLLPLPGGGELRLNAPLPADLQAIVDGAAPAWPDGVPDAGGLEEDDAAAGVQG